MLNGFLAFYALWRYKSSLTLSYTGLMLSTTLYALGYAFELASVNIQDMLFWLKIQYIGIPFFPTFFMLFTLRFTGNEHRITPGLLVFLFSFSLLTMLIQFINPANLFYTHFETARAGTLLLADFDKGTWYWAHQAFSNIIILICIIMYVRMVFAEKHFDLRLRAFLMLIASIVPWPVYIFYLSGASPGGIDLNPFSFTFIGVFFTIGLFRFHILDFVPLALENVFESMNDGVILLNHKQELKSYNKAASLIFGELSKNSIGKQADRVLGNYPELIELIAGQNKKSTEFITCTEKGLEIFKVELSRVLNSNKKTVGFTLLFSNITEIKRYADKLKALNATKDKFFAIIAHDLRNPFNALNNLSDIIIDKIRNNETEEAIQAAALLQESSYSAYNLLQNLLEWSNIQRDKIRLNPELVDISLLIEQETEPLRRIAEQKGITILSNVNSPLLVFADKNMLLTIVRNLVNNAIKYSFSKGTILIHSKLDEDFVVFSVVDQGIGMSSDEVEKLFSPEGPVSKSGTSQEPGSGLGLLLCREFVEMNKGKIWAESKPGEGSTFFFSIPRYKQ